MSSLIRRLQIRILKAKGFVRQTQEVAWDDITDQLILKKIRPAPWPRP